MHPHEGLTFIEIKFEPLADDKTRVELTQDNWENMEGEPDWISGIRGGYEHGWKVIFAQKYLEACSA